MANDWNPNAPEALGLEWLVTQTVEAGVAPGVPNRGQTLRSRSAETINSLRMMIKSSAAELRPLTTIMEIFEAGDEVVPAANVLTGYYAPNADIAVTSWVSFPGGATTNLWSYVDSTPVVRPSPADVTGVSLAVGPPNNYIEWACATGAFPLTARVNRVYVAAALASGQGATAEFREFAIRFVYYPTGALYTPTASNVITDIYGNLYEFDMGEINPVTQRPWTPLDIREFDGGDWGLRVESVANGSCFSNIYDIALKIRYQTTENRVAAGVWRRPTSGTIAQLVSTTTLTTLPGGGSGWAKANAQDYTYIWREAADSLLNPNASKAGDIKWLGATSDTGPSNPGPTPPEIDGKRFPPVPGMRSSAGYNFGADLIPIVLGTATKDAMRLDLIRSDTNASQDSQGYIGPYSLVGYLILVAGQYVAQRVTPGASDDYLGFQFLVIPPASGGAPLTVTVHRQSDNVQMGGSFTITADEIRALPAQGNSQAGYRLVTGFLSAGASLVSGTGYEVRVTAGASPAGTYVVSAPTAFDGSAAIGATTFGGTTDCAENNGSPATTVDLALAIFVQPDPVRDFVAAGEEYEFPLRGLYCSVEAIDLARLTWTAPATTTGFVRYVIQRQTFDQIEETFGDWEEVAYSLDVSSTTWTDVEGARGRPIRYRIRQETITGAFSEWVYSDAVVVDVVDAEVVFATNARPDLLIAYDRTPEITYQFLRHEEDVFIPIYGRPYQKVFGNPFDRGVAFSMELYVNLMQIPDVRRGLPVFAALRRITAAIEEIPYVAVLDWTGNVTLGHLQVAEGTNVEPMNQYLATASVTEVTQTPVSVEF